jgi:hypothetical protein
MQVPMALTAGHHQSHFRPGEQQLATFDMGFILRAPIQD